MQNLRQSRDCTFTSVTPVGLEAGFAGAERVCSVHHAVSFIPVSTHCPVATTVIQRRVCQTRERVMHDDADDYAERKQSEQLYSDTTHLS